MKRKEQKQNINNAKEGFRHMFDRINEELQNMPDSDVILWDKGQSVTTKTREFTDSNGKTQRFKAVVAITKHSNREVVIFYNSTEDKFWDWNSDPSPIELSDPFYNFKPFSTQSFGRAYGGDIRTKYGKKRRTPSMRIKFGDDDYIPPQERQVDQYVDSLDLDKSKFQ